MWHRIACASLLVILSWGQLAYAAPVTADPAQVKGLLDTLHQPAKKSRMRPGSDGFIRFVGTAPDNHFVVNTPASSSPEDVARQFLTDHEAAFTSKSLHTNYILRRTSRSHGNSFVHVGQTYMGLDVFGSGMVIQVNEQGGVACVVSDLLRDTTPLETGAVPVTASMASASARQMALDWMAAEHGYDAHQFQSTPPQLIIFDPQLVGAPGQLTLAWKTAVWLPNAPVAEDVLIDARSGQVVFHYSLAHDAKTRTIYDANSSSTTATLVRSEGQGPCAVADANAAYDYFGHTYDFYLNAHARLSIDNADMTMVAIVRYCDPEQCPMQNAFWSGTENRMYFGAGFVVDDVVAHELTHGVTQYESGLIYYGQSGAINEALSDIWGEFVDLGNAQGNDAASVRWLMGEDLPSGAIRDMENPPAYYQPDKMTSAYYYEGAADNGGVHINSGVANKMCFLLTDGGTFNGQTVQAMGIPLVADLFYEVQTNLLTPSSGFLSLYSALEQAAINLSFTNEQRNNILAAGQAVEIDDAPPSLELANVWWSDQIDTDEDGYYSSMTLNLDCDMPGSTEPISAYAETYYYDDELDDWIFWMQTPTFSVTGETDEDTMSMPIYPHAYGEYDYAVIVWRENAETPDTVVFPEDGDDLWGHPEELMDEDGATPTISLAEALDAPLLTWSSDTPRPWVGQALISHDAEDAARSYPIPDDGYCTMSTSLTGPGMLSFWWKVSCEENFDFLWLTIDGQTVDLVTGEQDWTQVTGVVIPQGTHEVTWIYSKDFMWSAGHDCGWVDQVVYERDRCAVSLIANPSDGGTITPDLPPDTEGKYEYGAVLSLLATAHEGYTFSSWSGAATGSDNPVEVTVTADITVTANFLPKRQLTLIVSPQASGTITADPLPDDDGKYASGTTVTLTANPNPGYTFGAWSGAATGPTASVQVTMDANKTVTATFVPKRTLTLTVEPADAGTIVANPPPGVDGKYVYGTVVTVTANANTGYSFGSWSGAAGGMSTSVQLIMNTDKALTAHFVPDRTLSLAVSPLSAGTITANPPPNPNGKYTSGTTVILTATPASAYTFGAWSGQATGTDISTEIIMDADKAVTATFLPKCTLTLATTPEASGTVTASPLPGADGKYVYGTIVKLTAQAGTGYSFGAWNGDATGSTLTTYVTMDANKTVTAAFVQRFSLALTASPAAGGSFSISPAPGGDGKYAHGTVVTATAKPAVGFEFSAWTGNATGTTNPLQITVNANKNVTANFARRFALSSTCNPLTGGTIIQNPLPGADGLYSAGTMVTLTATPRSGYSFGAWSGGGATGTVNPIQVTVDATKTVTASFIP